MNKFGLYLIIILSLISCNDRDDDLTSINIRVKNNNDFNYETVTVSGADSPYENVAAGKTSEYKTFEEAFQYASIVIQAEGQTYVLQPIDFVGETPLGMGFYTYQLTAKDGGTIQLEFTVD